jgi:hypothetical protein
MSTIATLKFSVELTQAVAATLQAAVAAVVPPYALLTSLGVYVASDSTAIVASSPRKTVVRTVVLQLRALVSAGPLFAQVNNNGQVVSVTGPLGSGFGGQPRLLVSGPDGPPTVAPVTQDSPVFRVDLDVGGSVVAQGGNGYTAPVVAFVGPTLAGGQPAQATALFVPGGAITGLTITNPGGPYCTLPVIKITDPSGSGGQAMSTGNIRNVEILSTGSLPQGPSILTIRELFTDILTGNQSDLSFVPAQAAILSNLMGQQIQNAVGSPVIPSPPVIV